MNIKEIIRKSGLSQVNLISPCPEYCREMEQSLKTEKRISVSLSTYPKAEEVNIVCHGTLFREEVISHALFHKVLGRDQIGSELLTDIYRSIVSSSSDVLSVLRLSNNNTVSRYKAKQYADLMALSGLFLPVPLVTGDTLEPTGRILYLPFFYTGRNERVIAMRYLSSRGFNLMLARAGGGKIDILATLGDISIAMVFGGDEMIDVLNKLPSSYIKVIVGDEPVVNFSQIRSMTIEGLLSGELL